METLVGKTESELCAYVQTLGEPPFRGKQLYQALYQRRVFDCSALTNLAKDFRAKLTAHTQATTLTIANCFTSTDGTRRYLLRLGDGYEIESVFMPEERHDTICISCQVGCAVGCTFCMTAQLGIKRNLTAGEIVAQVMLVLNDVYGAGQRPPHRTNLVFMGMGESFLNYDEVMQAVRLFCDPRGMGLSQNHISISTSGIVPRIKQFGSEPVRPLLAISLSGTTDEQRTPLIPLNKRYGLDELLGALRDYPLRERERLTFEYVMLDGVNDSDEDARRLIGLIHRYHLTAWVNLIPHNPAPELPYRASPMPRILAFQKRLMDSGIQAFIRRPRGQDISAACGQLAARQQAT